MRSRRGVLLVELLFAALLLGGAAVTLIGLVQSNARRARDNREDALARMAAIDLATLLMDEPVAVVQQAMQAGAAGQAVLRGLWVGTRAALTAEGERAFRRDADWVIPRIRVTEFAPVAAGAPGQLGLYRLTLAVADRRAASRVSVLFRPSMRKPPRKLYPPRTPFSLPRI